MFNTKEFAWANVEVAMLGRLLTKVRGVKYTVKTDKEAAYARGDKPFAIQSGNKSYEGELMLLQSELEAILKQLKPTEDITDLSNLTITVVYKPKNGLPTALVTHILKGVEFTEDARDIKQGDKFQELTAPFLFLERESI